MKTIWASSLLLCFNFDAFNLYLLYKINKLLTGQCLAHYFMGSGFIAYATISSIILMVGEQWVRRSGRSPELWDSWCVVLSLYLLQPHILLDKGNHHLGMPSDYHMI